MKATKSAHGYEFGGPVGVFFLMIALPVVAFGSVLFCNSKSCSSLEVPSLPPLWGRKGAFFDVGHLIVAGWIVLQVIIYLLPVGKVKFFLLKSELTRERFPYQKLIIACILK